MYIEESICSRIGFSYIGLEAERCLAGSKGMETKHHLRYYIPLKD